MKITMSERAKRSVSASTDFTRVPPQQDTPQEFKVSAVTQSGQTKTVMIFSKVLKRNVKVAWKTDEPKVIYVEGIPYSETEIKSLLQKGLAPQTIATTHNIKNVFDGVVE